MVGFFLTTTQVKTLFSESEFIHDFLGKQHLAGEQGYLVTTLQVSIFRLSLLHRSLYSLLASLHALAALSRALALVFSPLSMLAHSFLLIFY
jgi:hypothetical protein